MLVNREVFPIGRVDPDFKGGLEVSTSAIRQSRPAIATCRAAGHAPFHVRRPLRLRLAGARRLSRQYRLDHRFPGPGEAGGGRPWWMPGQWTAGGEKADLGRHRARCHHPMRVGNRLYTSYWHGGFVILNIDDITKPKFVSGLDWSPPFPWPTHTALPVPFPFAGGASCWWPTKSRAAPRPDVAGLPVAGRYHRREQANSLRELPGSRGRRLAKQDYTGLHQFCEEIREQRNSDRVVRARAAHRRHRKSARAARSRSFMPAIPDGAKRVQSNDVCFDDRGLIYLIDRTRGLHILERVSRA